ncbi:MAG: hydroxymethylglutaryl-CoA synthase family protein [Proteobacteria bacterium]|nr:hydroxymethylglutaryl-CoA synthase family protein [Pseudomonadota bacterium]
MTRGVAAWGAYLPRRRLARAAVAEALAWRTQGSSRASGERAYANWDEDAITLAVEAAWDATAGVDRARIGGLHLASTTLPFADRSNAGVAAEALALTADARTQDATGSQRAATAALIAALEGPLSRPVLVAAAERRRTRAGSAEELAYADGAAAMLVAEQDVVAEYLGSASSHVDLVDHYRAREAATDYALEERWVRTAGHLALVPPVVTTLLQRCGASPAEVAHLACPLPLASSRALARALGVAPHALVDTLEEPVGHAGCAHALLLLGAALERAQPGDLIIVVGFGQGADALAFRATAALEGSHRGRGVGGSLAAGVTDHAYVRFLSHSGALEMDWGMRAERDNRTSQSAFYRRHRDLTAFAGGRCRSCGTVQFPRAGACVNPACRAIGTQEEVILSGLPGRVKSYTEDWLAFSPAPPLIYGNVALEGGGNVFAEFTDVDAGELAIGSAVRFAFRIKDRDPLRTTHRYFWKATPVRH